MVDPDKVYLMTKAALFEEKEQKNALKTVSFRRKDYIFYHMLIVMLSASVGYAMIVGGVLFLVIMANDLLVLSVGEMLLILAGVILGYIVLLIIYYMVSHKYYGERHVKARQEVKKYQMILKQLSDLVDKEEKQEQKA